MEGSRDENDPLITTVSAKATKPTTENPLFSKIKDNNTAIRELTGQVASLVQTVQCERQTGDDK